jgi:poly(3-hydroxybutyrate) depolymerase
LLLCASLSLSACGDGDPKRITRGVRLPDLDGSTTEPAKPEAGMTATGRGRMRDAGAGDAAASEPADSGPAAEGSKTPAAMGGASGAPGGQVPPGEPPPGENPGQNPPGEPPPTAGMQAPPPEVPRIKWPTFEDDAGIDEDDAGVPPPPAACSGKPGSPGSTTRMYGDREFIVHVPPGFDPNKPLPVVFAFHGAGGKGADMEFATQFDVVADMDGVVMVYPTGQAGNAPWNVGRNVCPPGNFVSTTADDVAYFDAMLDSIEHDQCIDRGRVFVTGFSMGGYMSNQLGCQLGRARLRAVAPHSGGTHSGSCEGGPLPVLLLHGDADSLINYRCGTQARDYWVDRNGCSPEYDTWDILGGQCQFHRGCPRDAQVVLCTFYGMDHAWAYPPMWESSSLMIWSFFSTMF